MYLYTNIDQRFDGKHNKTELMSSTPDYDIYVIQENEGDKIERHFHRGWDESWIIKKGKYKIIIGDTEIITKIGDVITVNREVMHSVETLEDGSQRIAIFKKGTSTIFKIGENDS
jgi:quercetin dioxygenase-like cupin family protein